MMITTNEKTMANNRHGITVYKMLTICTDGEAVDISSERPSQFIMSAFKFTGFFSYILAEELITLINKLFIRALQSFQSKSSLSTVQHR